MASGSLGQGLSNALGTCQAKKLNGDKSIVYTLHGDGELQEGQNWEAIMFAAHNKVDNYIATIDVNGQQIDGPLSKVLNLDNLEDKFKAFNWTVLHMDGHNMDEIVATLEHAKTLTGQGKPIVILMKTIMGKGVDFMETGHEWHGIAPNDAQLENALGQLEMTLGDF
jgi:transketolase